MNCARCLLIGLGLVLAAVPAWAKPRVSLVIGMERGVTPDAPDRWNKMLTEHGVDDVQLRSLDVNDALDIQQVGKADAPAYRVTGTLSAQNVLSLPGGRFTLADSAAFEKWVRELGNNGVEGITVRKTAFGLTPTQFQAVHQDLETKLVANTKGVAPLEALSQVRKRLKLEFSVDPTVRQALSEESPIREELSGLSAGTAIAAILRPAGLVLIPVKNGAAEPQYQIISGKDAKEFWPIGWPSEKAAKDALPILFEFLNVEFNEVAGNDALDALQGRLKVPFLYDYNGLAKQRIDLTQKKISIPERKTFYQKVVQHAAQQCGLKFELRVDDAGQPFLWFSPLRGN